jgi:membrane-associated phospholipid phosphatase
MVSGRCYDPGAVARPSPTRRSRRATTAAALGAIAVFGILAVLVAAHPAPFGVDLAGARIAADIRADPLTGPMRAASLLGSSPSIALQIAAVGGAILLIRRDPGPGLWLLAAFTGAWFLSNGFKALLDRPRPEAGLVGATGTAFPSGHATQGAAFFLMLAIVLATALPRPWRLPAAGAAITVGVLSGLSRIYLGVHWLTDVLGGFALGAAWLAVLLIARRGPATTYGEAVTEQQRP